MAMQAVMSSFGVSSTARPLKHVLNEDVAVSLARGAAEGESVASQGAGSYSTTL